MKIATYNVYSDPEYFLPRFKWIINALKSEGAEVLCLQEINENHLADCQNILEEYGYYFQSYSSCLPTGPYGILTAALPHVGWVYAQTVPFEETMMGRSFIHLVLDLKDPVSVSESTTLNVINTHLESMYQFQKTRNKQAKQIIDYCLQRGIIDSTVLCGDLNTYFHNFWSLEKHFTPQIQFPTWFAQRISKTKKSGWFDRIYTGKALSGKQGTLKVVGNTALPGINVFPSDHDGVVLEVVSASQPASTKILSLPKRPEQISQTLSVPKILSVPKRPEQVQVSETPKSTPVRRLRPLPLRSLRTTPL